MKVLTRISLIALIILTLSACGLKLIPSTTNEGTVDLKTKSITIEKGGIKITAMGREWEYSPIYLEDYYTPLYVIIRNETEKEIYLKYEDLILIDDKGNQFKALDPEKVNNSLLKREPYGTYWDMPRPYNYWDYGWWRPFWYTGPWLYNYPYYSYPYPYPYPYINDLPSEVIPHALNEGKVLQKSQVRGFLYFQKATEFGKDITLRVSLSGFSYNFIFEIKGRAGSGY